MVRGPDVLLCCGYWYHIHSDWPDVSQCCPLIGRRWNSPTPCTLGIDRTEPRWVADKWATAHWENAEKIQKQRQSPKIIIIIKISAQRTKRKYSFIWCFLGSNMQLLFQCALGVGEPGYCNIPSTIRSSQWLLKIIPPSAIPHYPAIRNHLYPDWNKICHIPL